MKSINTVYLGFLFICIVSFFYYPKYNKPGSEATIGWDVSGYYWYLPSLFIYKDIKEQKWSEAVFKKYAPTPEVQQYFKNRNGYYVMKYSIGQAIQYFPFFITAHVLAKPLGFEADGFSLPYQFALQFGGLVFAFLGLWYLRKILLHYFSDGVVAWVIIAFVLATNYLNYTAIDNAMTHTWLFAWYCILIHHTILFYQKPTTKHALIIGLCLGISALTRPTDIVAAIIPLLWGINSLNTEGIKDRISFWWSNKNFIFIALSLLSAIVFIQLIYFKYAGEEWIVYSYQEEGFSWLKPHFKDYMTSFRTGWLLYTPVFILSFIGMFFIRAKNIGWLAMVIFTIINTYIVTAWDIWWYGGRAMIQSYPTLAFFMAAAIEKILQRRWLTYLGLGFTALCIYYNIWWTHGVHRGGYFDAYNMTKAYYYKLLGRWSTKPEWSKLFDTNELFEGVRKDVKKVYAQNFDADSTSVTSPKRLNGSPCDYVDAQRQYAQTHDIPISPSVAQWLRVNYTGVNLQKEWNFWLMTQVVVKFFNHDALVKQNAYRPSRQLNDGQIAELFFDVKIPTESFNKVQLVFWNSDGTKEFLIDNINVETFNEK